MHNDRQTIHGSLVSVLGRGILLVGESGAGKSKLCLEAIKRGHKLVADDAVELHVVHGHLIGKAPENIAGLIEVKGREIFDVREAFGKG
ncbi:MAG: HPr kinase/phosphorylase, partial [Acidobacteriota bacterium]